MSGRSRHGVPVRRFHGIALITWPTHVPALARHLREGGSREPAAAPRTTLPPELLAPPKRPDPLPLDGLPELDPPLWRARYYPREVAEAMGVPLKQIMVLCNDGTIPSEPDGGYQ